MRADDGDFLNQSNLVVVAPFHSRILRLAPIPLSSLERFAPEGYSPEQIAAHDDYVRGA